MTRDCDIEGARFDIAHAETLFEQVSELNGAVEDQNQRAALLPEIADTSIRDFAATALAKDQATTHNARLALGNDSVYNTVGPELLRLQAVQDALLKIETEVKNYLEEQAGKIEHDLAIAKTVMRGESPALDELALQRLQQVQQDIYERHPRLGERLTATAEAMARLGLLYETAGAAWPLPRVLHLFAPDTPPERTRPEPTPLPEFSHVEQPVMGLLEHALPPPVNFVEPVTGEQATDTPDVPSTFETAEAKAEAKEIVLRDPHTDTLLQPNTLTQWLALELARAPLKAHSRADLAENLLRAGLLRGALEKNANTAKSPLDYARARLKVVLGTTQHSFRYLYAILATATDKNGAINPLTLQSGIVDDDKNQQYLRVVGKEHVPPEPELQPSAIIVWNTLELNSRWQVPTEKRQGSAASPRYRGT